MTISRCKNAPTVSQYGQSGRRARHEGRGEWQCTHCTPRTEPTKKACRAVRVRRARTYATREQDHHKRGMNMGQVGSRFVHIGSFAGP